RPRVDTVEIAILVIIAVIGIEVVARPQVVGDFAIGVARAETVWITLAAEQLLGLAGRQAAIVLLGQARRTAADAIPDRFVATDPISKAMTVTIAMTITR